MVVNYAVDSMINIDSQGMTDELWELAKNDAKKMRSFNIEDDSQRNILFYIDHFCEDICEEFGCNPENREKLIEKAYSFLKNKKNIDLNDFRMAFLRALGELIKTAYPNIRGVSEYNLQPKRDLDKWISALQEIQMSTRGGKDREKVAEEIMEDWDEVEKLQFKHWSKYYEENVQDKYGLKPKLAFYSDDDPFAFSGQPAPTLPEERRGPGRPRGSIKKEKTIEDHKRDLMNKLYRASKILEQFKGVWDDRILENIYHELNDLRTKVFMLKTASTMDDCIIRMANVWERRGIKKGAEILRKVAQPPEGLSSEIENALKGNEYKEPEKGLPKGPAMPPSAPAPEMEKMEPPAPEMEKMEPPAPEPMPEEGNLEVEEEELPPPQDLEVEEAAKKENPYEGSTVQDVLNVLEPVLLQLKERQVVREFSKADMMMEALNIVSHFPEFAEIQSKQIESNIYIEKRLNDMINKLKGGLGEKKQDEAAAPEVEMEELESVSPPEEKAPAPEEIEVEEQTGVIGEPPKTITDTERLGE